MPPKSKRKLDLSSKYAPLQTSSPSDEDQPPEDITSSSGSPPTTGRRRKIPSSPLPDVPNDLPNPSSASSSPTKTPVKSKKRRNAVSATSPISDFFTPRSKKAKGGAAAAAPKATVTPSPPPAKKDSPSKERTQKSSVAKSLAVSYSKPKSNTKVHPPTYIPTYIHANVGYTRRSDGSLLSLPLPARKALEAVLDKYDIPPDFETRKYGPLSGLTWEKRVLNCYDSGALEAFRHGSELLVCVHCGRGGHKRNECPDLL